MLPIIGTCAVVATLSGVENPQKAHAREVERITAATFAQYEALMARTRAGDARSKAMQEWIAAEKAARAKREAEKKAAPPKL